MHFYLFIIIILFIYLFIYFLFIYLFIYYFLFILFYFIYLFIFFFFLLILKIWVPVFITKTRLCNFDPRKPHFYIVKLEFTEVNIIFPISAQNIDCGYSLEPPRRGGSNEYPQSLF